MKNSLCKIVFILTWYSYTKNLTYTCNNICFLRIKSFDHVKDMFTLYSFSVVQKKLVCIPYIPKPVFVVLCIDKRIMDA